MTQHLTARCKFTCSSVTKRLSNTWDRDQGKSITRVVYDAKFFAVSSGSPENDQFFASTPAGELSVQTYREDLFVPGQDYYLDLIVPSQG